MPTFTLTRGTTTKTLEEWRVFSMVRKRSSQAVDALSFGLTLDSAGAALPFSVEDELILKFGETIWFRGRVTSRRRSVSGNSAVCSVEVAGPWWYLEQLVYQQPWATQGSADTFRSHCLLNLTKEGQPWSTREQIHDALTWARDRAVARYGSAPFQWTKESLPEASIPSDEVRDTTTAEIVRRQFRWLPDCVTWFDYSTTPPTFWARRRSQLAGLNLAWGPQITAADFMPREDLVVPSVALKFEQVNAIDGSPIAEVTQQIYPPGATGDEFGALVATIDLAGGTAVHVSGYVRSEPLPGNTAGWTEWLKTKEPWLNDTRVQIRSLDSISRAPTDPEDGTSTLPRELLEGGVTDWMTGDVQQETVKIRATLRILDDAGAVLDDQSRTFTINIQTTNIATGTYSALQEFVAGEPVPVGLAQTVYEGLSTAEYQGSIVLTDPEFAVAVSPGMRLSVTGADRAWETMGASVQEVAEDLVSKSVRISVGPPSHLGPRDLVDLLRVNRFRLVISRPNGRSSGTSGGSVSLPKNGRLENATAGSVARSRFVVRGNGSIDLDSSLCLGQAITIREIGVCVNGVQKKMLILASLPYDA